MIEQWYRTIPPPGLVLLSIVAIQVGAALAIQLFPALGASGTAAVRIVFSALLLALAARGRVRGYGRLFVQNWRLLLVFGLCIAAMNFFFYAAIARIPLGVTVAIEFIGPLSVAVLTSRRLSHLAWIVLAALGIALLSPLSGVRLDAMGILYALLAGTGWALFIIVANRVGDRVPGSDGLAIAMAVAAITMIPFVAPIAGTLVSTPLLLVAGVGVALLATTIPFSLEYEALKRLPARTYGVLVSLEPAVAATVGALFLGERIGTLGLIAVACVVVAAIGITFSDGRSAPASIL